MRLPTPLHGCWRIPAEAHRLGANGRRRVENEFTWKASAAALLSVVRDVLEQPERTNS